MQAMSTKPPILRADGLSPGRPGKKKSPLPMRHGVSASRVWLPKLHSKSEGAGASGTWSTVLEFMIDYFPFLPEALLKERMALGHIVTETGEALTPDSPYQEDIHVFYYREIPNEPTIPFYEKILYKDEHIIVVDKPHFVPVTPTGRFIRETLLSRLKHRYQDESISPVHRLDRDTAGVMLFSCNPKIRGAYQNLFQKRRVTKTYEAIAPVAERSFPYVHRSHVKSSGNPFFIMCEDGQEAPNTETCVDIIETRGELARYRLQPVTGRQHQLRVHMMSIGCPIVNDPFYPVLLSDGRDDRREDYSRPLQLLAKSLNFIDPLTNEERFFESELVLETFVSFDSSAPV